MRRLIVVPGFVARVALAALLAVVALVAVLTRTGVGRDASRRSLEAAFARQFDGTLSIGELRGTLFGTFDARAVVVRTRSGDTLLTARRVLARPTVPGLFSKRLELRSLDLEDPVLALRQRADGTWDVLRPRRRSPVAPGPTWSLGAPVVRVTGGTVIASSAAPAPDAIARGDLADVRNARYGAIDGQATVVWTARRRLVSLERLRLTVQPSGAPETRIDDLAGQFVDEDGVTTFSALHLESGATDLRGSLRIVRDSVGRARRQTPGGRPDGRADDRAATWRATTQPTVRAAPPRVTTARAVVSGRLDADALARLVPALPLGGVFRLDARADGARRDDGTADATVRALRIESGAARLAIGGDLRLALTRDSLTAVAQKPVLRAAAADVRRIAPRLDAALAARIAALVGSGASADAARIRFAADRTTAPVAPGARPAAPLRFTATADGLAATLPDADVRGDVRLTRTLAGLAWRVDADVRRADLDRLAAAIRPAPRRATGTVFADGPTQIAGRIDATGTLAGAGRGARASDASPLGRLRVDGRVALARSTVAGRAFDSLRVEGRFDGAAAGAGRADVAFALAQPLGGGSGASRARGRAVADLRGGRLSQIALDVRLDAFDAALLAAARPASDALRTRLSGTATAALDAAALAPGAAPGALAAALTGTAALRLDATRIARGARTASLGPLTLDAMLAPRTESGAWGDDRLVVEAGALSADVRGTLREPALADHAAFFAARLGALARASLRPRVDTAAAVVVPEGMPETAAVRLGGTVRVRDASALAALLPVGALARAADAEGSGASPLSALDDLAGDLDATVDARVDGGGLRLALDVTSARLRIGARRIDGLRASATLSDRGDGLAPALSARLHADSLALPRRIGPTDLKASLLGAAGAVTLRADGGAIVAEGVLERAAAQTGKRAATPLRLVVRRLALARGDLRFSAPAGAALDLYADAVVVPATRLDAEGAAPVGDGRTRQTLTVGGTVSGLARDTLVVRAAGVDLARLLGKRPERAPIGGVLDADVALSALLARPDLTGEVRVRRLSFGAFAAGDLTARADFRPGDDSGDAARDATDDGAARGGSSEPIGLTLTLAPPSGARDADRGAATVVRARGTFRLPDATPGSPFRDGALDLAFDADRIDASVLDAMFPEVLRRTTGTIVGSGTVTGSLRRPTFAGELRLRGARLAIPRFGLAYSATADARLSGDGLSITTATLTDPTGGTLAVGGGIGFNDYRFLSLDLRGQLRDALLLNVPTSAELPLYGRLWASGEATLTGPVSGAVLRAPAAVVSARSEVSLPIRSTFSATDAGFIVFADSSGRLPDLRALDVRESVFRKPTGERTFVDGLEMEINLTAPAGSTINLVVDPLRGDVMRARSSGRLQIARREGEFTIFGGLDVSGGDYLFTAGDLFARRFRLDGGRIAWDGNPVNPSLDIAASFRTRASLAGLPQGDAFSGGLVPLIVRLDLGERLLTPSVGLSLALDRSARSDLSASVQGLEALLNVPERQAEYATSVLLTNSFLLTTTLTSGEGVGGAGNRLAFASLSQLVGAQVNRYLSSVVPGLEFTLGLDGAEARDLDVSAGVALRLLDERLVIRGEGVFATESTAAQPQGLRGEFVVEIRLSRAVSAEVYYRREDDALERLTASATTTTGASLSYRAQFTTWGALWRRLVGR